MLSALDRKMLRDLRSMWAQALAIALVLAAGIAMYVMSEGMLRSLIDTRAAYYDRYGFAEIFAPLKRAPNTLARRLEAVPGLRFAETRIKKLVTLDMPALAEPVQGHVLSYPVGGQPRLNRLHLAEGRWPAPGRNDEVLVSDAFAEAHELDWKAGDTVTAVLNGRKRALRVVGLVLSAEFIYAIQPGAMIPDNRRYGILWMSRAALEAAFDMKAAFNDVVASVDPGTDPAAVIDAIDRILEPYGGTGAYEREHQVSDWYVSGEINQLRNMANIVPPIFLAVAAFLLNVVLTRWIDTQREEIGLLKAFGYTTWDVAAHYLKLVAIIALGGTLLGFAGGIWLGRGLAVLYQEFFRFPFLYFHFTGSVFLISGGVGLAAALMGTIGAVRRAALLAPATAMAPPPPTRYARSRLEGWFRRLSQPSRMIARHLVRWPARTGLTVLGNAAAVAVLIGSMFFIDAMETLIDISFHRAERQDVTVTFTDAKGPAALDAVRAMPGVLAAEPFRSVAARLTFQGREEREGISGLIPGSRLNAVLDSDFQPVSVPDTGLVLSSKLAEKLGAGIGDVVIARVTEGRRPVLELPVVQISETLLGSPAFMDFRHLGRLMREQGWMSGARVHLDAARSEAFFRRLKDTPAVAGVAVKSATLKSFRDTMQENLFITIFFNIGFAAIIALGVLYNAARISLSERARELASMRVLGFTKGEVAYILLGEMAIVTLVALPLGCLLSYGLAWAWTVSLDTDLYRVPLVVSPRTYGWAVATVLTSAALSGLAVARRLGRLDMVKALKTRE